MVSPDQLVPNKTGFIFLTETNISYFFDKKIEFRAPSSRDNHPYRGITIIRSVDYTKDRPIVCDWLTSDDLSYARLDDHGLSTVDGGETYQIVDGNRCFSYSDRYREVEVRICE